MFHQMPLAIFILLTNIIFFANNKKGMEMSDYVEKQMFQHKMQINETPNAFYHVMVTLALALLF